MTFHTDLILETCSVKPSMLLKKPTPTFQRSNLKLTNLCCPA